MHNVYRGKHPLHTEIFLPETDGRCLKSCLDRRAVNKRTTFFRSREDERAFTLNRHDLIAFKEVIFFCLEFYIKKGIPKFIKSFFPELGKSLAYFP